MMQPWMLPVLLLVLCASGQKIGRTHFYVQEGKSKCFIEETVEGTPLTVSYENYNNPGVPCSVVFKDPRGRAVYSRSVSAEQPAGKVAYMPKTGGEYEICASCEGSRWFGSAQLKWSLSVDVGDTELPVPDAARSSDARQMLETLGRVHKRLSVITAENEYYAQQEEGFRAQTDKHNRRLVWIAVVQISVMLLSAAWGMRAIARHFKAERVF